MSELKARTARSIANEEEMLEMGSGESIEQMLVYPKSDVDKVIAELNARIADGDRDFDFAEPQNERLLQIVRHHKYKRCMAMALWCESKVYHIRRTPLCDMSEHEYWQYEDEFWQRWQNRWQEIAEKFKEVK